MIKLIIEYNSVHGEVVPDGRVYKYVDDIISTFKNPNITSDIVIITGSVVIFDAFRLEIKKGKIDYKKVILRFNEKDYQPNEDGTLNYWPTGLCDIYDKIIDELVFGDSMMMDKKRIIN